MKNIDSDIESDFILEQNVLTTQATSFLEKVKRWGQANSLWPVSFSTACCGLELSSVFRRNLEIENCGLDFVRLSPQQSDLLIVAGTITEKQMPILKQVYNLMPSPKWVMSVGACASSGGFYNAYNVVQGISREIPVDVYVPGCPPTPAAIIQGLSLIQERVLKGVSKEL